LNLFFIFRSCLFFYSPFCSSVIKF